MFLTSSTLNLTVLSLTLNCNHSNTNRARTQVQRCLDDRRADEPNYRSRGFAKFLWSSDQDQDDGEYEVTKGQGAVYVLSLSLSHPIKVTHTHTNPNSYISVEDRSRYTYDQVREKIFGTSAGRDIVHVTISSEFVPDREVPVESYIREWNLVCLNREGRVVILTRKQSDVIYNDDPPRFTYIQGLELRDSTKPEVCLRWLQDSCEMGSDCEFLHKFNGEIKSYPRIISTAVRRFF